MFALNVIEEVLTNGSCQGFGNGFTVLLSKDQRELAESFRHEVERALAPLEPQSVTVEVWSEALQVVVMINDLTWSPIVNEDGVVFLQGIDVGEEITPDEASSEESEVAVWPWD